MPWNDNANPGPWGSPPPEGGKPQGPKDEPQGPRGGPRGPGGGGPRRPPPEGVDLNELIAGWTARLRRLLGGGGGRGPSGPDEQTIARYLPIAAGLGVLLLLASGVVVVGERERAVITTFGAWTRTYEPGIGYRIPIIEGVQKVPMTLRKTTIGGDNAAGQQESLMLTGDENIVDLRFTVNWRVSDPGKYLFNVKDADSTLKAVAESAMREVVGRSELNPILSTGKAQIQIQAAELMQGVLNAYDSGIIIDSVQIEDAQPPKPVVAAFQDVATAGQNKQTAINEAQGEASRIRQQALGYKAQVVNEARGEAERFNQVYDQYRLAPGVTRDRLYIETMERVLAKSNKVIIDGKGVTAPIVLSPDVFKPKVGATAQPRLSGSGQ